MEQGNVVPALNSVSLAMAFPVELLHEVILLYLADCFLDLIMEPNVEKIWDPLSSPLHTSSLFREITAGLLGKIFGEVPSRKPGESPIVNYRSFFANIKRIHSFAFIDDPKALLGPDFAISSILIDPQDRAKSNLIFLALQFAVAKVYTRLCEPSSGVTLVEAHRAFFRHPDFYWTQPSGHTSASILGRIFAPICERRISLRLLIRRIFCLQGSCTLALGFNPHLWSLPDDVSDPDSVYPGVSDQLEELQRMPANFKAWGFDIELPIPPHTLEAMKVQAALLNLEPPPGRSENDSLVRFCRRVQKAILRNLHVDQQDVLRAELAAWRARRDSVTSGAENNHESNTVP